MPKKFPKILITIFLTYFSLQLAGFLILAPPPARADESMPNLKMPELQIDIGKFTSKDFTKPKCETVGTGKDAKTICKINWIGEYIAGIYEYAIGIVGILATVVMMVGGIIWLTAGGNATRVGEAKSWITASLTGLVIALSSYMILYQINPDLIKFKPLTIGIVKEIKNGDSSSKMSTDVKANAEKLGIKTSGSISEIASSAQGKVTYRNANTDTDCNGKGQLMPDGNTICFDCSGFTKFVYDYSTGGSLPDGSSGQLGGSSQQNISSISLQPGAIVGWIEGDTINGEKKSIGHVFIYDGQYFWASHGGSGRNSGQAIGKYTKIEIISAYGDNLRVRTP